MYFWGKLTIMYDLIIIGGGPIGIACGIEAKKNGLSYCIIEKGPIVNSLYNYPTNMQFFSSSEKLEIDNIPFISKNAKPSKAEALEYYRRIVTARKLNLHLFEKVETVKNQTNGFVVTTSKESYDCKNVVVATGFYDLPNKIHVKGENLPHVFHYYHDPHYYSRQKVIVVGASNSSVDAALEIWRKGGDVTMVIRGEAIGERVKYWVKPDIENRISEGSIRALFSTKIKEIRTNEVDVVDAQGKTATLSADFVLALTGYLPNFAFLQQLGVDIADDEAHLPAYNPETMETNQKGLYLAGVICGGTETHKWFIENSRIHAKLIVHAILEKKKV